MTARTGALRRRRKPSLANRLRICWIFIVLVVGAAGYLGYVVITLPALRVHTIDVHIEGLTVTEPQVLQAAKIDRASNVWLLDTNAIAQRIESIPYVDRATIRRAPPAALAIDVTLREAAACVRSGMRLVTVDASRRVVETGCARPDLLQVELRGPAAGNPGSTVASATLPGLLAAGRALRAADIEVRSVTEDGFGQLIAVDSDGIELLFAGDGEVAEKAKLVAPVLAAAGSGRRVRAVDLRAAATPTVEYR